MACPALLYNVAILALFTLNGVFAERLARALGAPRVPALLGGVLAVTLPFVGKVAGPAGGRRQRRVVGERGHAVGSRGGMVRQCGTAGPLPDYASRRTTWK